MLKINIIISMFFIPLLVFADTPPPGTVKAKMEDGAGTPITSTLVSGKQGLDVNVVSSGGSSTVNQGTPNGGGVNSWYVQGSLGRTWNLNSGSDSVAAAQSGVWSVGRTWSLNSGTDSVTVVGSISATNPSVSDNNLAIPAFSTLVGGSDGTNLRPIKTSATGVLLVDGSAVTQPVSGSVSVSNFPGVQAVSQSGTWTIQQGSPPWSTNLTQLVGATPSVTNYLPSRITNGTAYVDPTQIRALTSSDVVTANQGGAWSMSVSNFPATQPVSGTVTANQGGAPWSVSQSGNWSVRAQDGSGNLLTSQANGAQRALDVGINVAGVQVDPRTRTWNLSSGSDSVAATQSGAWTTGRTWTLSSGTDSIASAQSGTWNITNVSGTVSLPTGASTSANQTSQITQETTTATNTTSMLANQTNGTQKTQVTLLPADTAPATQNITVQDTTSVTTAMANAQSYITGSATAGSTASFSVVSAESVEVQVTGTWTGTLQSEISMDGGTTWLTRGVKQAGVSYIASSFTGNFSGGLNATGMTNYRVRATTAWTGTATVRIVTSDNAASITVSNPVLLKDSTTQSITNTIKAASTAALTTDTSLVVALSPNSATPAIGDRFGSGSMNGTGQQVGGVSGGASTCYFTITGTWTGVLFFSGVANGAAPVSLPAYTANGAPVSLTFFPTVNNTYAVNCAGFDHAYANFFSFTSGTASVAWNFGSGTNYVQVNTASTAQTGSAVPTRAILVAGSDGTNARNISTDTGGIVQTSLGNTSGKTMRYGSATLNTTTTTANQVVATYTVTAAKTYYLQYWDLGAQLQASAATSTTFGTMSLTINGTVVYQQLLKGPGVVNIAPITLAEPIPVAAGQIVQLVVTPAAVTGFTWNGNFGGYEK